MREPGRLLCRDAVRQSANSQETMKIKLVLFGIVSSQSLSSPNDRLLPKTLMYAIHSAKIDQLCSVRRMRPRAARARSAPGEVGEDQHGETAAAESHAPAPLISHNPGGPTPTKPRQVVTKLIAGRVAMSLLSSG